MPKGIKGFQKRYIPWNKGIKLPYQIWNKGKNISEEHREKIKQSKTKNPTKYWLGKFKENHPKWIKNRNLIKHQEDRNNPEYKQWRYCVYKRDRYICRINNEECMGKVVAHHILSWRNYPELRYIINNGITLCQAHHPIKGAEEKRLAPTFQELVSVLN